MYVQMVDVVSFVYACLLCYNVVSSFVYWVLALIVFTRIYRRWWPISLVQLECIVYTLWMYLFGHSTFVQIYCTLVFSNHRKMVWKRRDRRIKKKKEWKNSNRKKIIQHLLDLFFESNIGAKKFDSKVYNKQYRVL